MERSAQYEVGVVQGGALCESMVMFIVKLGLCKMVLNVDVG